MALQNKWSACLPNFQAEPQQHRAASINTPIAPLVLSYVRKHSSPRIPIGASEIVQWLKDAAMYTAVHDSGERPSDPLGLVAFQRQRMRASSHSPAATAVRSAALIPR